MGDPSYSSPLSKVSKERVASSSSKVTKNQTGPVSCLACLSTSQKTGDKKTNKTILNKVKPSMIPIIQSKQGTSLSLTYNPSDYAQNFDDGRTDKEDDPHNPTFASKYAASSSTK
ncbi:hypothetical protein EZV62_006207 [Acer yangbiense]|uniref:Uncharacterized protein n=1 Tax=Acer yangbiense TaxID=1000413 RepID=A0A5C7ISC8_9ROSI|nr:hypothetical protein EZV62_006169 [Acer yangbiense]TXG71272.1 hypothetical protein EZV62_006207 [Acer yangbiense]